MVLLGSHVLVSISLSSDSACVSIDPRQLSQAGAQLHLWSREATVETRISDLGRALPDLAAILQTYLKIKFAFFSFLYSSLYSLNLIDILSVAGGVGSKGGGRFWPKSNESVLKLVYNKDKLCCCA